MACQEVQFMLKFILTDLLSSTQHFLYIEHSLHDFNHWVTQAFNLTLQ